uniref:HdeD family acid-resistance protein n=1 Tax=Eubacterium cellulosolvens TaxID=29322 RepID=UPI00048044DA|nr:DUF308 domain-containing protein [[Eubacterium] cellulosolvens]
MESSKIVSYLKNIKRNALLCSILLLFVGLFLLIRPGSAISVVCRVIGAAILIAGVSQCANYLNSQSKGESASTGSLVAGVVLILVGLLIVVRPNIIFDLFNTVIAFILIFYGITELIAVHTFSRYSGERSTVSLISGALTLVFGFLLLVAPFLFHATELVLRIAGAFMIYTAISSLFFKKQADNIFTEAAADFCKAADGIRDEFSGRSHYDANGKEIIDSTAVDVDDSTDNI